MKPLLCLSALFAVVALVSGCLEITRQTASSDASQDAPGPCVVDEVRCSDQIAQRCDGSGEWVDEQVCAPEGFCVGGACVASQGQQACIDVVACALACRSGGDDTCFDGCVQTASNAAGETFGRLLQCTGRGGCDLDSLGSFYEFTQCVVDEGCAVEAASCLSGVGVQGTRDCGRLVSEASKRCDFFESPDSKCARNEMKSGSPEGQTWFYGYASCLSTCHTEACAPGSCSEFTGPGRPCGILPGVGR